MSQLLLRECSTCGGPRAFEAPDCAEGHGPDCPDLACVECGEAVFVGLLSAHLSELSAAHSRAVPAA
ncbi:MAG: hypothetical protein DLM59_03890 [Pseudonocardiales bacterium]|nr:MAG: hypothetical protein DLM59_03890 [Pseudonocardiales bacterium]